MAIYVLTQNDYDYETNDPSLKNIYNEMYYEVIASQQITNDVARLVNGNRVQDAVCEKLGEKNIEGYKINVDSSEKNRVINLSVTYEDAIKATNAVQAYAQCVSELSNELTEVKNVKIIDEPKIPEKPSGPPRLLIAGVSAIAGLLFSIIIIFLKDLFDTTVDDKDELIEMLGIPVLANIPKV